MWSEEENNRVLVVDDNIGIHYTFDAILAQVEPSREELEGMAKRLFSRTEHSDDVVDRRFELVHAMSGEEGLERVREARCAGGPFALAFVDVRMNPGWSGVESVRHFWGEDPDLEIVLCTAYTDLTWRQIARALRVPDQYLILRKPFEAIEVRQLAHSLTAKWLSRRRASLRLQDLEIMVEEKFRQLDASRDPCRGG